MQGRSAYLGGGSASGGVYILGICIQGGLHLGGWQTPKSGYGRGELGRPIRHTWDTMGYGQQSGGTHPTGMHSFSFDVIFELI